MNVRPTLSSLAGSIVLPVASVSCIFTPWSSTPSAVHALTRSERSESPGVTDMRDVFLPGAAGHIRLEDDVGDPRQLGRVVGGQLDHDVAGVGGDVTEIGGRGGDVEVAQLHPLAALVRGFAEE